MLVMVGYDRVILLVRRYSIVARINLLIPEHAYIFGFLQADGNAYRRRNHITIKIELSSRDGCILERIADILNVPHTISHRRRSTNFIVNHESVSLTIRDQSLCRELLELGLPVGCKSKVIAPPVVMFSEPDYYRGLIDGDGSVGVIASGNPFISLTTDSDDIASSYLKMVNTISPGTRTSRRNVRDDIYNIVVRGVAAQSIVRYLYYPECLALKRKVSHVSNMLLWAPKTRVYIKKPKKDIVMPRWTPEEDMYILSHTIDEAEHHLNRTYYGIRNRRLRLLRYSA